MELYLHCLICTFTANGIGAWTSLTYLQAKDERVCPKMKPRGWLTFWAFRNVHRYRLLLPRVSEWLACPMLVNFSELIIRALCYWQRKCQITRQFRNINENCYLRYYHVKSMGCMKIMNDSCLCIFIDLDSKWKIVTSFTLWPFYLRGKLPLLHLRRDLVSFPKLQYQKEKIIFGQSIDEL